MKTAIIAICGTILVCLVAYFGIITPPARGYQRVDYTIKDGVLIPMEQGKQLNCVCKCTEGFERGNKI